MSPSPRHSFVRRLVTALLTVPLLAGTLGGCGGRLRGGPEVVTSFYPLQYIAQRVAGPYVSIGNLTAPGQEPHDLTLTVRQTAEVAAAKVVFYEKGLQPAVDATVDQDAEGRVVDAASIVPLRRSTDPEEPGLDPHIWLDPVRYARLATGFAEQMSREDPSHAAQYRSRAQHLARQLHALDAEYQARLRRCSTRALVVSHDAFTYLGRRYGLRVIPIAGLSPDAEPSVGHLSRLRTLARRDHVTTVFTETLASPKLATTLASEIGVHTAVLDPLEGLRPGSGEDYLSVMRANLAKIAKAGGCG